jgi:DNA invertase Pin-like site-specific DNA recombinase
VSVYGYIRVSTEVQLKGAGLEIQRDKIQAHALSKGLEITEMFTDPAESASVPLADRPGGAALLLALRPGDHVIVSSLDRAWRSIADATRTFAVWKKQGIVIHILNLPVDLSTPLGELVFSILAAVAQFERAMIAERIGNGVRAAVAARGGRWGVNARYGYRWTPDHYDNPTEEVPEEQEVLRLAKSLAEAGHGKHSIALYLTARGFRTRSGAPWTPGSVGKSLRDVLNKRKPKS